MLEYIPKETNIVVWTTLFNHMKWINERLIGTQYKSFVDVSFIYIYTVGFQYSCLLVR